LLFSKNCALQHMPHFDRAPLKSLTHEQGKCTQKDWEAHHYQSNCCICKI